MMTMAIVVVLLGLLAAGVFAVFASATRDRIRGAELYQKGLRRVGFVRDALPYASPRGGTVIRERGALIVLDVSLESRGELPEERIKIQIVEPSEKARERISKPITVLQHPDDPLVRAVEGFDSMGEPLR